MAKHYWTLARRDRSPLDARRARRVNDIDLTDRHVQAFRTKAELLTSHWMEAVAGDRERYGPPSGWDLVLVDGDGESEIIPKELHGLDGLFVKIYGELGRTDLMESLRESEKSEDAALARAAEEIMMTIEVMADQPGLALERGDRLRRSPDYPRPNGGGGMVRSALGEAGSQILRGPQGVRDP